LDREKFADVVAAVESAAAQKGERAKDYWHKMHGVWSKARPYASEKTLTAELIVVVREIYSKWPKEWQVTAAAVSYVCSTFRLPRSSLNVQPALADGDGYVVELVNRDRRFELAYKPSPGDWWSLAKCCISPVPSTASQAS
jgi:hypothetical protein